MRSLDRIITGEVARLVGFYEKATGVRASRANEDFAELGPLPDEIRVHLDAGTTRRKPAMSWQHGEWPGK